MKNTNENTNEISPSLRYMIGKEFGLKMKMPKEINQTIMEELRPLVDEIVENLKRHDIWLKSACTGNIPRFETKDGKTFTVKGFKNLRQSEYFSRNGGQIKSSQLPKMYQKTFNGEKCKGIRDLYEKYTEKIKETGKTKETDKAFKTLFKEMVLADPCGMIQETLEKETFLDDYTLIAGKHDDQFRYFIIEKSKIDIKNITSLLCKHIKLTCDEDDENSKSHNKSHAELIGQKDSWNNLTNMTAYIHHDDYPNVKLAHWSAKTNRDSCNLSFYCTPLIYFLCPEIQSKLREMIPLTKEYGKFIFGEQKDSQDDSQDDSSKSRSVSKESQENEENEENEELDDIGYPEGKKVVGKHTRSERSKKLPKAFFEQLKHPYRCEMCERSVVEMYPGLSNEEAARLIEGHHRLQISKGERNTKVSDLMALCPTCHRLVHRALAKFFKDHNLKDFESSEQENDFYKELRKKIHNTSNLTQTDSNSCLSYKS